MNLKPPLTVLLMLNSDFGAKPTAKILLQAADIGVYGLWACRFRRPSLAPNVPFAEQIDRRLHDLAGSADLISATSSPATPWRAQRRFRAAPAWPIHRSQVQQPQRFATAERDRPTAAATCSWLSQIHPEAALGRAPPQRGSSLPSECFRSAPMAIASSSATSLTRPECGRGPAICAARQRRSPDRISYRPVASGRPQPGCSTPCARMLIGQGLSASCSKSLRG